MFNFPPNKIVCLTEETVETIYLLGEEKRIVGVTGFAVRPERVRKEKPRISSFISAKIEKIEELKPDLIFTFSDIQADISKQLISKGLNVFCFNQRDTKGIISMIKTIGAILDCKDKSLELCNKLKNIIAETRNNSPKIRPKVYFEEWNDPLISGIKWVSELIDIAGGIDVFSKKSSNSLAANRIISSDDVIKANPDIIIASWCGKKFNLKSMCDRPGWEKINAVKNNKVFEIKSPLILQPGPATITHGLKIISKIIKSF